MDYDLGLGKQKDYDLKLGKQINSALKKENAAPHLLNRTHKMEHIPPVLTSLHWFLCILQLIFDVALYV